MAEAVDSLTGATIDERRIPYSCSDDWFLAFIDGEDFVTILPVAAYVDMPSTWKRGDPWPWNGDPADHEDQGPQGQEAPDIAFNKNSSEGTITVIRAETGLKWGDLIVQPSGCTKVQHGASSPVNAGDRVVQGCSEGDRVTVQHGPSNSLLYETTF